MLRLVISRLVGVFRLLVAGLVACVLQLVIGRAAFGKLVVGSMVLSANGNCLLAAGSTGYKAI